MSACTDHGTLLEPPGAPDLYAGWDPGETPGEFLIHFERVFGRTELYFPGPGIRLSGTSSYDITLWPWRDDVFLVQHFPPVTGTGTIRLESRWPTTSISFDFPVRNIRLDARIAGDLRVTCFDRTEAQVVDLVVPRTYWDEFNPLPKPIPVKHANVGGSGITRCTLNSQNAIVDDLRFEHDRTTLELGCAGDRGAGQVTRGQPITCTASAGSPDQEIEVTGWKFVSSDGQEEVEPLDPAQESSPRWAGPMVRSGTVHVTATVDGEAQTASAQVTVRDRNWSGRAPVYTFLPLPDSRLALPEIVRWSDDLGAASWFPTETRESPVPDFTTEVPSGPNDGLDYFSDETTLRVFGYYLLNRAAMSRGSRFYAAQQQGGGSGGTQIGGMNWCPASVVTGSLPGLVEAHEKLHGSAYERALSREAGAALARLERITASNVGDLYDEYDRVWHEVDRIARAESEAIHGQAGGLISPTSGGRPCALRNEFGNILQRKP